jgi:hypothetical protein
MNRLQVSLPAPILELIKDIAANERRSPRQQIEFFVIQAVRERGQTGQMPPSEEKLLESA